MLSLPNSATLLATASWTPEEITLGNNEIIAHKPKLDPLNYIGALRDRLTVRNTVNLDVNPFQINNTINIQNKITKEVEKKLDEFKVPMSRYNLTKPTVQLPYPRSSVLIFFPCSYPISLVPLLVSIGRGVQDVLGLGLHIIVIVEVPKSLVYDDEYHETKKGSVSYVKLCILTNILRANGLPVIHMRNSGEDTDVHTLVSYISHFQPTCLLIGLPAGSTEWNFRVGHGFIPSIFKWITCLAVRDGFDGKYTDKVSAKASGILAIHRGYNAYSSGRTVRANSITDSPKTLTDAWSDENGLSQQQEVHVREKLIGNKDIKDISFFLIKKYKFIKDAIGDLMNYSFTTSVKHIATLETQVFRPSAPPFPVSQIEQLPPFGPYILRFNVGSRLSTLKLTSLANKLVKSLVSVLAQVSSNRRREGIKEGTQIPPDIVGTFKKAVLCGLMPLYALNGLLSQSQFEEFKTSLIFRDKISVVSGSIPHITNLFFAYPFRLGLNRSVVLIEAVGKYSQMAHKKQSTHVLAYNLEQYKEYVENNNEEIIKKKKRIIEGTFVENYLPTTPINMRDEIVAAVSEEDIRSVIINLLISCQDLNIPVSDQYKSNLYTYKPTPLKEFLITWEIIVFALTGRYYRDLQVNPHKGRPTYWGSNHISTWDDVGAHLWAYLTVLQKFMGDYVTVAEELYIYKHTK